MPESLGQRLTDAADAPDYATNSALTLFSTDTSAPTTFVTPIVTDTAAKLTYVWDGTQYVKIADYA